MTDRVCIHLGCGRRHIPGWLHVDVDDYPHIDYRHSVDRLPMFSDDYADLIYNCHQIAYFDRFEIREVFREWRRVLKPGGVLRLSTPDFGKLIDVYRRNQDLSEHLGFLYGRYLTQEGPIYHKMMYDEQTLYGALEEAGFSGMRRYDWRNTVHKDYDDYSQAYLPHMDKDNGTLMSLNVEAVNA